MKAAIRDDDCVLFFEHKYLYRRIKGEMPAGDHVVPIGKARVAREGTDLSIITYAATVCKALEAAEQLEKEDGLSVEVIDLRSLAPARRRGDPGDGAEDEPRARSCTRTRAPAASPARSRRGSTRRCFEWLDAPVLRVTAHDVPLPYAPSLEDFVLPQTADIVRAARRLAAY